VEDFMPSSAPRTLNNFGDRSWGFAALHTRRGARLCALGRFADFGTQDAYKKIGKARKAADSSQTVLKDSRCSTISASNHREATMSDSYTNLLYHVVFSTKERRPLITPEYEPRLYEYIGGIVRGLGGISLELNGTEDHVHLLAKLRPDRALSDVLRKLKANATGWLHDVFPEAKDFSWQRGYGAFTVSHSNVEEVRNYLRKQKEHHAKISFRVEFIQFLKANGIEFDERYV
jgi:REP element-mobilizing transposase RayT